MTNSITRSARFLKRTYVIRVYKDGDGHGFIWCWWNPATWIIAPLAIAFVILMQGLSQTVANKHDVGIGVHPWFVANPGRLEWLP